MTDYGKCGICGADLTGAGICSACRKAHEAVEPDPPPFTTCPCCGQEGKIAEIGTPFPVKHPPSAKYVCEWCGALFMRPPPPGLVFTPATQTDAEEAARQATPPGCRPDAPLVQEPCRIVPLSEDAHQRAQAPRYRPDPPTLHTCCPGDDGGTYNRWVHDDGPGEPGVVVFWTMNHGHDYLVFVGIAFKNPCEPEFDLDRGQGIAMGRLRTRHRPNSFGRSMGFLRDRLAPTAGEIAQLVAEAVQEAPGPGWWSGWFAVHRPVFEAMLREDAAARDDALQVLTHHGLRLEARRLIGGDQCKTTSTNLHFDCSRDWSLDQTIARQPVWIVVGRPVSGC